MSPAITDYKVEFRDVKTKETIHVGTLIDALAPGVFNAEFTPTLAGTFHMYIQFNGLEVDSSPYAVNVVPAFTTSAA